MRASLRPERFFFPILGKVKTLGGSCRMGVGLTFVKQLQMMAAFSSILFVCVVVSFICLPFFCEILYLFTEFTY
jgi:hypothetical protein